MIIPARNEPDLDDLPESVREQLTVHPVADVADVLALALEPEAGSGRAARRGLIHDGVASTEATPFLMSAERQDGDMVH